MITSSNSPVKGLAEARTMSLGARGPTLLSTGIARLDSAGTWAPFSSTVETMPSVGTNSASSAGPDEQPVGRHWMRWLPGLSTVRSYRSEWLRRDLVAGLVKTTMPMLVSVGIAYTEASGLH